MFYHRCQGKVVEKVITKHPKRMENQQRKEILRLEKACVNLKRIAEKEEQDLYEKEQVMKQKEAELDEQYRLRCKQLLEAEMRELYQYGKKRPEFKRSACYFLESYFRGVLQQLRHYRVQIFGSERLLTVISGRIRNKLNLRQVQREMRRVCYKRKIILMGHQLMLTVKLTPNTDTCVVSLYSYVKSPHRTLALTLQANTDEIVQPNIDPLYNILFQGDCILPLGKYLQQHPNIVAVCWHFYRVIKAKLYLSKFRYFRKHTISQFFQHEISTCQPPLTITFLVTVDHQHLLTVRSLTPNSKVLITQQLHSYQSVKQLFEENVISIKQNKLIRRINYLSLNNSVIQIQAVFRSHALSKRFRASQRKGALQLVASSDRRAFVSCVYGEENSTIYYQSMDRPTVAYKLDRRYSEIVRQEMSKFRPTTVLAFEHFQGFVDGLNQRIEMFEVEQEEAFRNQPKKFFERLRRFFFKIKVKAAVRRNRLFVVKVPLANSVMALLCFQAPIVKEYMQVRAFELGRIGQSRCRAHEFLIRKEAFEDEPTRQSLLKLFYITGSCCFVSPRKISTRYYVRWLSQLKPDGRHSSHLFYNLYGECQRFFLEVYCLEQCSLYLIKTLELTRKEACEYKQHDIEALVLNPV